MSAPKPFVSSRPYDPSHPRALAIYCSDGRFTEAVEDLVHALGDARLDALTLPGGPALLNRLTARFAELDTATRAMTFLVLRHAIDRVVLVAHEGCGYYRERYPLESPGAILARQRTDLGAAAAFVRAAHPAVRVDCFVASPAQGKVVFTGVAQ